MDIKLRMLRMLRKPTLQPMMHLMHKHMLKQPTLKQPTMRRPMLCQAQPIALMLHISLQATPVALLDISVAVRAGAWGPRCLEEV